MSLDVSRRALLKSGASLAATLVAASLLTASANAADKPASLNMLYATSEANSDAIKAALPDFKAAFDALPPAQRKALQDAERDESHPPAWRRRRATAR